MKLFYHKTRSDYEKYYVPEKHPESLNVFNIEQPLYLAAVQGP